MATVDMDFLTQEFCAAFAGVFQQNAGEAFALQSAAPQTSAAGSLGFRLHFEGAVRGALSVWMEPATCAVLAAKLLGDPVDESLTPLPEHEDAVAEIMNQISGAMSTALRERFGESSITVERTSGAGPGEETPALRPADGTPNVLLLLQSDAELQASAQAALSSEAQQSGTAEQAATAAAPAAPAAAASMDGTQKNLELVMDVELDLTLRFGKRTMMLSEISDLTSGSVIELDRVVDEPVELLLGDRVIARGDVVIVDGNYGLRVTELAAPEHAAFLSA